MRTCNAPNCDCKCHDEPDLGGVEEFDFDRFDACAADEAIVRWRRREVREALYQLERAFGGKLHGLADLTPEQLK